MPTYEYRCEKCGEHLEVFQSFSDPPLTRHETDGGKLAKVLSPAGFILKGSGFYKTDNRSSGKKTSKSEKGEKAEKADKTDSGSSSSSSSDASSSKSSDKSSSKSSDSSKASDKPSTKSA
jgi:putative FmdB family regulatory protein